MYMILHFTQTSRKKSVCNTNVPLFSLRHALLRRSLAEVFGSELAQLWTNTAEEEPSIPFHVDQAAWEAFRKAMAQ